MTYGDLKHEFTKKVQRDTKWRTFYDGMNPRRFPRPNGIKWWRFRRGPLKGFGIWRIDSYYDFGIEYVKPNVPYIPLGHWGYKRLGRYYLLLPGR